MRARTEHPEAGAGEALIPPVAEPRDGDEVKGQHAGRVVDGEEGGRDHRQIPREVAERVRVRAHEAVRRDALAQAALGDLVRRLREGGGELRALV